MMKRLMAIVLMAMLMIGETMPAFGLAEKDKTENEDAARKFAEEIFRQNKNRDPFAYLSEKSAMKLAAGAPEKFDLSAKFIKDGDEKEYVTPVKFQNPFGTCWGFAAIAGAETSIIGSGLAEADGYAAVAGDGKKELDLSERHLTYFVNEPIVDEGNPQNGEGRIFGKPYTVPEKLNTGGAMLYAASLFASGIGPNLEDRIDSDTGESMYDLLAYGTDSWTIQKRSVNGGEPEDFCYDDETNDWSIPESKRFYQSYTLKDSALLPSPVGKDTPGQYTYNEDGTNAIKAELLEKRAVTVAFHADSFSPSQEAGDGQYISKEWAHYTYDLVDPNHGVTIVGWDDTYPKENFVEGHEPPANGAWLVKNSWGSGEREFPNKGTANWGIQVPAKDSEGNAVTDESGKPVMVGSGYFWLSYYDKSMANLETYEFDKSNVGRTYHLDQHDMLPIGQINTVEEKSEIKMANVFQAEENQILDQITTQTTHPNTEVESKVYLLPDDFTNPEEGKLVATVKEKFALGGYHKTEVYAEGAADRQVIQKGQYYSVVQTHRLENGTYGVVVPISVGKGAAEMVGIDAWYNGIINEKESFVYNDNSWLDYSKVSTEYVPEEQKALMTFDNFPIKVYSDPVDKENDLRLSATGTLKLSTKGEKNTSAIRLGFKGAKGVKVGNREITWNIITPDGASMLDLQVNEKNKTQATLTGKKAGRVLIEVKAGDLGSRIISVTIEDPVILIFSGNVDDPLVYTGKPVIPELVAVDNFGELIMQDGLNPNMKFTYKNNVKCGIATALLVPITDYYTETSKCTYKIVPKAGKVKKIKIGKNGSRALKITVKNQKKSGVSKYQVQYRVAGKTKWSKKTFKAKTNKVTLKKLKKGKKYEIRVRAYAKRAGYGEFSKIKKSRKVK